MVYGFWFGFCYITSLVFMVRIMHGNLVFSQWAHYIDVYHADYIDGVDYVISEKSYRMLLESWGYFN